MINQTFTELIAVKKYAKAIETGLALGNILSEEGKYKEALSVFSKVRDLQAKLDEMKQLLVAKDLEAKYHFEHQAQLLKISEKEGEILKNKNEIQRYRMRLLILAFTLIFILVIFIFLFISNRNRHRNELLKTEVKNKNDELTRLALHISEKNQLLQDLSSKIKESEGLEDNKQIYLRIANILQSDKESEYFHNEVNAFLAKFRNKLNTIYDNLKEKDLRLCALIQLGLSSKEIANIFNISSKSVDMQRYRLRKKIGIPQNVSIEEWLNKIDEKP